MTDTNPTTAPGPAAAPASTALSSPKQTTAPPTTAPDQSDAAASGDGTEIDYRALYEQAQSKLSKAEHAAREHKVKATKLDEIEATQQSETEKAARRAETAEHQVAALRRRAVEAEIRAAASGWADPTDAPRYLDDRDRYVGDDGEIDTAAITADLTAVLLARPHLARAEGTPASASGARRPAPDHSQGSRQSGPAGPDARIADAEQRGDWATAISLKNQRLAEQALHQR